MNRAYIDTNVILRFLTGDPQPLAAQARRLFETVERGDLVLVIDEIVIAETVWVLQSFYGHNSQDVALVLRELLVHDGVETDDKAGLLLALNLFANKNIDFVDALVAVHMKRAGVQEIYSFDRHFDRLPNISRLQPEE